MLSVRQQLFIRPFSHAEHRRKVRDARRNRVVLADHPFRENQNGVLAVLPTANTPIKGNNDLAAAKSDYGWFVFFRVAVTL
jgi:hypothetical protein